MIPRAGLGADIDQDALFAHAVKVWTGDLTDVAVWLSPAVARFAPEYPLHPDQTLTDHEGGVLVRARVAGITEATRWTLAWGANARAIEPPALVAAVREELTGALTRYDRAAATSTARAGAAE